MPPPRLSPTTQQDPYVSARYGDTLAIPEGWELTAPATTTWAGSGPWRTGETDVYANAGAKRTFEVAARSVPEGLGAFDFVGRYVPRRGGADEPTCGYNGGPITGPYIAGAGPVWAEVRPEPRRTLVRATCEVVDAVVFIDATAYVMKLSQTGLQLWAFDELLSALSFDEPPIAFNSARYGYSIELTQDWQTAPAIRDWTGTGRPAAPMTDAFIDPRAVARFTIAARDESGRDDRGPVRRRRKKSCQYRVASGADGRTAPRAEPSARSGSAGAQRYTSRGGGPRPGCAAYQLGWWQGL